MGKLLFQKLIGKKPTLSNIWTFSSIKEIYSVTKDSMESPSFV
jgi:hypothetical protein